MADKKEEEDKKEGEAVVAPKGGKGKLIIIIVVLLVVIGGGAAGFFLLSGGGEKKEGQEEEVEEPKVFKKAKFETFIVNLSEAKSFLKVGIQIEYDVGLLEKLVKAHAEGGEGGGGSGGGDPAASDGALPVGMAEKDAILKDTIIRVLSSKRAEEIFSPDGKQALKDELLEAINEVLAFEEPVVVAVYFTEFLIQ